MIFYCPAEESKTAALKQVCLDTYKNLENLSVQHTVKFHKARNANDVALLPHLTGRLKVIIDVVGTEPGTEPSAISARVSVLAHYAHAVNRATEIAAAATRLAPVDVAWSAAATVAPPRTALGSRSAPIAFGDRVTATDGLEVRVVSVDFDAWVVVQAENQFNQPPEVGMRMILISLEVTNHAHAYVDVPRSVSSSSFRLVGNRGIVYAPFETNNRCGVIPDEMNWELFTGATVSGNVCVQTPADESEFRLIYLPGTGWPEDSVFFALP
jgi:hypothetical protein